MYICTYQLNLASSHIDYVEAKLFADSSRENGDFSSEEVEKYRTRLFLFRARLSLLHGNTKNCKKEIKRLHQFFRQCTTHFPYCILQCEVVLLFRTQCSAAESQRGISETELPQSTESAEFSTQIPIVTEAGECLSAFYYNNMACIHFYLSRYHLVLTTW